jgi:hypothetical protein
MPSGTPSWNALVSAVRRRLGALTGEEVTDQELDLLQVPLLYSKYFSSGRRTFDLLEQAFKGGFQPNKYHSLLAQLPVRTFMTTNWDLLLEESLEASPLHPNTRALVDDSDVSSWNEARGSSVLKLHGSIDRLESVIFSEDDYYRRYGSESLIFQLSRVLMSSRSLLMIGFSLGDPFVKLLLRQVRDFTKGRQAPHWYVAPVNRVSAPQIEYIRDCGFTPIIVRPGEDPNYPLEQFLEMLVTQTGLSARNQLSRSHLLNRETTLLREYQGSQKVLRIRAMVGPFGNPSPSNDVLYGSAELDHAEYELHELCSDLTINHGFIVRMIGDPTAVEFLRSRGYSNEQLKRRLQSFRDTAIVLGNKFEFVPMLSPADRNQWICADQGVIDSGKSTQESMALLPDAVLSLNRSIVETSIRWFDEDFAKLRDLAGGCDAARIGVIERLTQQIASL